MQNQVPSYYIPGRVPGYKGDDIQILPSSITAIHVHVATSDFQTQLLSRLPLTSTHLRKQAVATLSYTPTSKLHPQVIFTITFFAGLNGLHMYVNPWVQSTHLCEVSKR